MSQKKRTPEREAISRAAGKKLYLDRKLWGCCILCGKPLPKETEKLSCDACLKKRADYREQNRSHIREYAKDRMARLRAAGLCVYCGNPAIPGQTQCKYHREYYSRVNRVYRNKMKEAANAEANCS